MSLLTAMFVDKLLLQPISRGNVTLCRSLGPATAGCTSLSKPRPESDCGFAYYCYDQDDFHEPLFVLKRTARGDDIYLDDLEQRTP